MGLIVQGVTANNVVLAARHGTDGRYHAEAADNTPLMNVSGVVRDFLYDLNAPNGAQYRLSTACPAGSYWYIEQCAMRNVMRAMTAPLMGIYDGVNYYQFWTTATLAINTWGYWQPNVIIAPGETIFFYFTTMALNDDIYWQTCGHSILI
jgi:hypothetical protein